MSETRRIFDENGICLIAKEVKFGFGGVSLHYVTNTDPTREFSIMSYSEIDFWTKTYDVEGNVLYVTAAEELGSGCGTYRIAFRLTESGAQKLADCYHDYNMSRWLNRWYTKWLPRSIVNWITRRIINWHGNVTLVEKKKIRELFL